MHPGAVVAGRFERKITGWRGIPQSYECTEHLSFEPGSDKRVWIVPAFAHPIGAAAALPGFGASHMAAMRSYPNLAVLTAMLHDETSGHVLAGDDGRPVLRDVMNERDRAQLARGLAACARLLLAAGAVEVTIPAIPPQRDAIDLRTRCVLDLSFVRPHAVPLTAVHPMGTRCAWGRTRAWPSSGVQASTISWAVSSLRTGRYFRRASERLPRSASTPSPSTSRLTGSRPPAGKRANLFSRRRSTAAPRRRPLPRRGPVSAGGSAGCGA